MFRLNQDAEERVDAEQTESLFVQMAEKIRRYEIALAYYADQENYENVQIGGAYIARVVCDSGEKARLALDPTQEQEGE